MRPVKLIMSAFGPYSGETVIDFGKLGKNGIYLITGDTGAGKTTIFDSIVFALYGESSDSNRKPFMFRSKYATFDTPTFVELEFINKNNLYKIKRNPEYMRLKNNGKGFTKVPASCELITPNGKVITRTKEVDTYIKSVVGIDKNQFMQIAMIAQGDFKKLLLSSTDERKKIFRQIFKTELFEQLQSQLKDIYLKEKRNNEKIIDSIKQYINGIVCDCNNSYYDYICQSKQNTLSLNETVETLRKLIEQDKIEEVTVLNEIKILETQLKNIDEKIGKLKAYTDIENKLIKAQQEIQYNSQMLIKAQEKHLIAQTNKKQIENFNIQCQKIKNKLPEYDRLNSLIIELNNTKINLNKCSIEKQQKEHLLNEKNIKLEHYKNKFIEIGSCSENKLKLENIKNSLEIQLNSFDEVNNQFDKYFSLKENYNKEKQDYIIASKKAENALSDYTNKHKLFLDEQAGILAETLQKNVPCPVCGSVNHPCIAHKSHNAPSKEELNRSKKIYDKSQLDVVEKSNKCAQTKGILKNLGNSLKEQLANLNITFDENCVEMIKNKISSIQSLITQTNNQIQEENKKIKVKSELEQRLIPQTEKSVNDLNNEISQIYINTATYQTTLSEIQKNIDTLKKDLYFPDKQSAQLKIYELEQKIRKLNDEIDNAEKELKVYENENIRLKSQKDSLESQIATLEKIDETNLNIKRQNICNEKLVKTETQNSISKRYSKNNDILDNIIHQLKLLENSEKKYTLVKNLSETANGGLSGKEKIMLETYIQMTYFDRIIQKANLRFMTMSDGQYEMKRRDQSDNKKVQGGLDIDIIDHYNGSIRSVNTLSGGESFKASLSLALGLSDEVQESTGGVQLDTMFVDEGFGTLDEESLQQAMSALINLSNGNKLVGIISHVNELKEKINKQIIIKKDRNNGSKVDIVV